jgi:hypothetical protein
LLHFVRGRFPGRITGQALLTRFQELFRPAVVHVAVDTFAAAQLGNAVLTPKTFEYNTDFLFGGIMASSRSTDISNSFLGASFLAHHRFLFRLTMS